MITERWVKVKTWLVIFWMVIYLRPERREGRRRCEGGGGSVGEQLKKQEKMSKC